VAEPEQHYESFSSQLADLINWWSRESPSNTPDFILAQYLQDCLAAWNTATLARERWYGHTHEPARIDGPDA
jgi:hypothetical protein